MEHEEQRIRFNKVYLDKRGSNVEDKETSMEWMGLVLQSNQLLSKLDSMAQQAGENIRGYLTRHDQHLKTTASAHLDTLQKKLEGNLDLWNREMKQKIEFEEKLLQEYSNSLSWYQQEIQLLQGENSNKESALEQLRVEYLTERQRLNDEHQGHLNARHSEYSRLAEKYHHRQTRLVNWHSRQLEEKNEKWQERLVSAQQENTRLANLANEEQAKYSREVQQADERIRSLTAGLVRLKEELGSVKESKAKIQQEAQQANEQIRNLTADLVRLRGELDIAKALGNQSQLETRQANESILKLTTDLARLNGELDTANASSAKSQQEHQQADKQIRELTLDLVRLNAELKTTKESSSASKQETQIANEKVLNITLDLAKVQDELKAARSVKEKLEAKSRNAAQQADEQIRKLRSELTNVKDELTVTRKLKQDLETSNDAQISKWQSTKEEMDKEFQVIREDLRRLESRNDEQVKSLEADWKAREGVEAQAMRAEGGIRRLEEQILEWKERSEKTQQEVQNLETIHRKEIDNLKQVFAKEKTAAEAEHQRQILFKEEKIAKTEQTLEDCRNARQEQAEQNSKVVQDTIRYWTEEINRVNNERSKEKDETYARIREAEVKLISKGAQAEKLREHYDAAQKRIQDLTTEVAQAKTALQSTSETYEKLKLSQQEALVDLRRTLEGTKNEMQGLNIQVTQLESERSNAAKKNKFLEEGIQKVTTKNKSLEDNIESVSKMNQSLEDEIQASRKKNKSLEDGLQRTAENSRSLEDDLQNLRRKNKSLEEDTQSLEGDIEVLTKKNKSLEDGIQSATAKIKYLEESLESARGELRAKEANETSISLEDAEETKQRVDSLQKEVEQLQWQLEKSRLDLEKRDAQLAKLDISLKNERDQRQELDKKLDVGSASQEAKIQELTTQLETTTKRHKGLAAISSEKYAEYARLLLERERKIESLKKDLRGEEKIRTEFEESNNIKIAQYLKSTAEKDKEIEEWKEKLAKDKKARRDFEILTNTKLAEQVRFVEQKDNEIEALNKALAQEEEVKQKMQEEFKAALLKEEEKHSFLFNEYQKLRRDIRVMCRIRPSTARDRAVLSYQTSEGKFHSKPAGLEIISTKGKYGTSELVEDRTRHYNFDRVFEAHERNEDVWIEIGQFIQSFVEGRKVTIFCYGQTATGKTYTMSNTEQTYDEEGKRVTTNEGIIPRARDLVFDQMRKRREWGWDVSIRGCCYEVYVKEIRLLLPNSQVKTKALDPTGPPWWHVRDPEYRELHTEADFDDMFDSAMESRTFAETTSNSNSSRSHFILYLEFDGHGPNMKKPSEGSLCLVDLAGSEDPHNASRINDPDAGNRRPGRADESEKKKRLREGIAINQSLRVLRKSISRIRNPGINGKPTIEGGDEESSTLAKLLGPCLGRESMVLMFVMVNLAADCLGETKASLECAREVRFSTLPFLHSRFFMTDRTCMHANRGKSGCGN